MSTGSSTPGAAEVQAVSSVLNDPDATKIDNKEDDAALVDSFFLPGGLFSDENNNNHQNESKITNSNHNLMVDSIPHTMTSRSSVHLPKNPWETETTSNTITVQSTNAATGYDDANLNDITGDINHFNFTSPCRDGEEEIITGTTIVETPPFHQQMDSIFSHGNKNQEANIDSIMINSMNSSPSVVRPPPGFKSGPTVIPSIGTTHATTLSQQQYQLEANMHSNRKSMEFLATPSSTSSTGNTYSFPSSDDHMKTFTGKTLLVAVDDSGDAPIPTSDLSDLPMNCPQHAFQQTASMPLNDAKAIDKEIPKLHEPTRSVQSDKYDNDNDNEESNSYLARYLKEPAQSKNTSDRNNRDAEGAFEALTFPITIGSKGKSRKSSDFIKDGDNDDDAEAHVQEEDTEENSIPSNICVSVGAESNSSSLSTCSDVENNSELSSYASGNIHHINDDDFKDEGVEYDTDQAHVSQIVSVMGNSECSAVGNDEIPDDQQSTNPAPSVNSEGSTRRIPSVNAKFHHGSNDPKISTFTPEKIIIFLRSTLEICHGLVDHAFSAMKRLLLNAKATKRYEQFSRQMRKLSRDFRNFTNWLMDVEEVFAVLLRRLLKVGWKYSRDITEAVVLILSFLFQLLKFGLIEAIEEFSGVTSCYIVFYLMPRICVTLMDYINLPHWTPHTVTWVAIFSLCHQVETGTLHETSNYTLSSLISKRSIDSSEIRGTTSNNELAAESSSTKTSTQQSPPPLPRQQDDELSRAQDKQICFLLLKILKTILPVLYMVEGFSSEFGTMIGASSTNRLTTAFVLSILRKSLLSSPIGWVSWALQVLLVAYYSSSIFLDIFILLIGLSSIRLIRFLDLQQTRGKRGHERLNK